MDSEKSIVRKRTKLLNALVGCMLKELCVDPKGAEDDIKANATAAFEQGWNAAPLAKDLAWALELAKETLELGCVFEDAKTRAKTETLLR